MKEITQIQYDKLCEIPEVKLILNPIEFDKYAIYILKGQTQYYKLHRVGDNYAFIDLNNSSCYANGFINEHDLNAYLNSEHYDIYCFNNMVEMAEFLIKNTKGLFNYIEN